VQSYQIVDYSISSDYYLVICVIISIANKFEVDTTIALLKN